MAAKLRAWLAQEAGAGRLTLWVPVAIGAGIAIYFSADREPALWAAGSLALAAVAVVIAVRRHPRAYAASLLFAAAAIGFAGATWRTARIAHPVLERAMFGVEVAGFVEAREERERTDRITVAVTRMEARGLSAPLERIRVSVRKGTAPPAGRFVSFKARLSPPLTPLRPGGYDFARDMYFQQLGASGFVLGKVQAEDPKSTPPARVRFKTWVAGARDTIDVRIRAALPGDSGAIASALITGKRDAISAPVNEAMYVSSLAHVLSISGYHMAVVTLIVFAIVRGGLALFPMLALRFPIKKWGAVVALFAATGYLILSGAETATQRAYIMTAIVLFGVLIDRLALTVRNLAVAAIVVLAIVPEAIVHPSFQMSFAATLALVAAYERGMPWASRAKDTSWSVRLALFGVREIVALLVASTVAGAATTLYAAYHFHRLAPHGMLANLLAMPVVSAWVMPVGLLALVAAPFGFDAPLWTLMGQGIEWMIAVALWVANLPGAVGRIGAFGVGPLLLGTVGLLLVCLLRSPLRWSGAGAAALGVFMAMRTTQPDIFVAPGAESIAVRLRDGRLGMMKIGSDTFAMREWLAADGDARAPGDPGLRDGFDCDESGCVARLADGTIVAIALSADAFQDDCRRAAVVVSRRTAPPGCQALVIDRTLWPRTGAVAISRRKTTLEVAAARPEGVDRPWARAPPALQASPNTAPDATPPDDDLRADD